MVATLPRQNASLTAQLLDSLFCDGPGHERLLSCEPVVFLRTGAKVSLAAAIDLIISECGTP
ncbi:hypothetical protein AB0M97_05650 [Streptomyces sp. NPDC051207]|uniref:hypothetical protein n=1 Tax=Streptomyces sp. NPDC051207 TaxID=3154641 RepID=UPI0034161551